MILVLFTNAILASYNQQDFTSTPVYSTLEEIIIRPLSTNVFYTNPSQKTNLVSQENQHPHLNDDFVFNETLPYGLSNQNNLNLVSLIKNQQRDLEFSVETQWIFNLNNIILKEIETKKKPFDLERILLYKNTLQKSILNYPTETTFDIKEAFVHYFITVLYSYSELTMVKNCLIDMKIIYSSCDSCSELEKVLEDFIDTINFRKDLISLDYIRLESFCMSCFPGFVNFKNIFPTNSSVDFTLIRERINLFISHLYYINQNSQYLDLISRFNLVFNSEYYCIVSPVSVFRTNILEKLCNIYLDKFAFFEIFSLLSYIKKSFIPFESYKKIEGTIIFIILLNSFYSNYCEYYKNAIMKSHDFTSQESFDNFEGFKAIFNDKNGILKKSLHFPVNMILNSMYLSKIFFILLIFNLKLEYPHFLRCNMFLYVIHLKVFYFPDKDLSEIYNEISFEEKSFFWCFRY